MAGLRDEEESNRVELESINVIEGADSQPDQDLPFRLDDENCEALPDGEL